MEKCVFDENISCIRPELKRHCELDIQTLTELVESGFDISDLTPEHMSIVHYHSGEISPYHHCPLYKKLFRKASAQIIAKLL